MALRLLPLLLVVAIVVLAVTRGFYFFPWPLLWIWFFFGRRHWDGGRHGRDSNRVTWI